MAEQKGKVVLFGKRWSGTATVAQMLVSGELKDCSLEPTDSDNECETYVGRGWTVVNTMGFGEPLGGIVPDEYVKKMVIHFLNKMKGRYSHIVFVVDRADVLSDFEGVKFMWRTFLETFRGGEENFVVLVTNEASEHGRRMVEQNKLDARIKKMFPECKHFLHTDFGSLDRDTFPNDGHLLSRMEALERFEKEMEEVFTTTNYAWVEPEISKMGDAEIQETANTISLHLTSSLAVTPRQWWSVDPAYEQLEIVDGTRSAARIAGVASLLSTEELSGKAQQFGGGGGGGEGGGGRRYYRRLLRIQISDTSTLQRKARWILEDLEEMQNLGKKVKFFPRQCEYLLQRSMEASKELHNLVGGTTEVIWDDNDDFYLAPLLKSLNKLSTCMEAAKELLQLCGNSKKEQEVAFTLSSRPLLGTTNSQVSKFVLVIRDLDWSIDAFHFLLHNPKAQHASNESERQSWLSNFLWCESRGRMVYVRDDANKGVAQSSTMVADNERQDQDQQDLISAMENYFKTFQNPVERKVVSSSSSFQGGLRQKIKVRSFQNPKKTVSISSSFRICLRKAKQLSNSEIVNYMSILTNRLQGDASFDGDSSIKTVPSCFRILGKQEYKTIQLIGKGSYKEVHKCQWLGMNVAIATESQCNMQSNQGGEDSRTILEEEARLLARVQHPNVITFIGYGYDEENRRGFQVSEIMESSLRSLIEKGYDSKFWNPFYPFSISLSIDILLQIAEAMIHVHECGVIYRDLKAENCLANSKLDRRDLLVVVVKLTDFGTSELQSPEMGCHFNTPNKGSRRWMAPELYQWPGDEVKLYTWSADVYSFGMTCYEVVTGEVPFGSILFSTWWRKAVCDGLRPTIPYNCPNELRELMTRCWAHSPEDRPTFKEIREILWRSKLHHTIWKADLDLNGMFGQHAIVRRNLFCGLVR